MIYIRENIEFKLESCMLIECCCITFNSHWPVRLSSFTGTVSCVNMLDFRHAGELITACRTVLCCRYVHLLGVM